MNRVEHSQAVVELARKLVSIPSVNPVLADDPAISGEHRMAEFVGDYLVKHGFRVDFHEGTRGRPNVVGTFGPAHPKRKLMIEVHLDTQGIHGMTVPPLEGLIEHERLYGRGACDMKGPMAAAMVNLTAENLDRLAHAGVQLQFVGAIGEETGNIGALELVDAEIGADEILVLEPTELHVVHAHKGAFWFEVEVMGVAAHGSNPEKGLSSIRGMGKVIDLIHEQTSRVNLHNKLLGGPTVNVGIIRGGSSINIVPERCVIEVDRRTVPGENSKTILDHVREGITGLVQQGYIRQGSVRPIKEGVPFETTAESSLVKRLCASCAAQNVQPVTEGTSWYSDAGPFSNTCREVAVFGPGSIRQAHTADEFIELSSLITGAEIIHHFLNQTARETF